MRSVLFILLLTLSLSVLPAAPHADQSETSTLVRLNFLAPDTLQPLVARLRETHPRSVEAALEVIGPSDSSAHIQVILAKETSNLADRVPSWIVGYANGPSSVIVLFPERVPSYPSRSLESVLTHEVAHVLIARATKGRALPRWFDEGLAMIAADRWDLEDRAFLIWAMVGGQRASLEQLDGYFRQDETSARQAYVLAGAFVQNMLHRWGPMAPHRILTLVAKDVPFTEAFSRVTSISLAEAEVQFWKQQTLWNRWIPVATSTAALWLGITLLALLAFQKQQRRTRAIRQQWDKEESQDR